MKTSMIGCGASRHGKRDTDRREQREARRCRSRIPPASWTLQPTHLLTAFRERCPFCLAGLTSHCNFWACRRLIWHNLAERRA